MQLALSADRSRSRDRRHAVTGVFILLALHVDRNQRSVLMRRVHVEHMVAGREQHLLVLRQHHRLQHIHRLSDVRHAHAVGMVVEDVERHRRYERIAHRVLLVKEARMRARLDRKPRAPLVHDQRHLLVGVVLVHDRPVLAHQLVHEQRLRHNLDPTGLVKLRGRPLARAVRQPVDRCIVMDGQPIHLLAAHNASIARLGHHRFGPVVIGPAGPAGDAVQLIVAVIARIQPVTPVEVCVILRRHAPAAAPVLVADAEVLHLPRLFAPILLAQVRHRALAVKGYVFDPLRHFLYSAAAHVAADVWLAAELIA